MAVLRPEAAWAVRPYRRDVVYDFDPSELAGLPCRMFSGRRQAAAPVPPARSGPCSIQMTDGCSSNNPLAREQVGSIGSR